MSGSVKEIEKKDFIVKAVGIITVVALIFQAGHFWEHILQLHNWLFVQTHFAYMSSLGMDLMHWLGDFVFYFEPDMKRRMMLGFESFHLIGNAIFVIGILGLFSFVKNKKNKKLLSWAFWVETFHFYEHVALTCSAIFINKSIGLSTFFGASVDPEFLLAYRVWWHFIFNFIPSVIVMVILFRMFKKKKFFKKFDKLKLPRV